MNCRPKESEKDTEAHIFREVAARGGMAVKLTSQFHAGLPDRLVLLPGAPAFFVEAKSEGCRQTAVQVATAKRIAQIGFDVYVADTRQEVDRILARYTKTEAA